MKEVRMFSVDEVLKTSAIKYNQSKLAKHLGIDRHLLRAAREDLTCTKYCILMIDGGYRWCSMGGNKKANTKR